MSIYTIGHAGDYDAALSRGHAGDGITPIKKIGPHKREDGVHYYGGYAFETVADARAYIAKLGKTGEWAIYEMDASWPADVYHGHPSDDFMRLNRDALIVGKVADAAPDATAAAEASGPQMADRQRSA
jgi:hypothetical protein